jgi:hypothetical protein
MAAKSSFAKLRKQLKNRVVGHDNVNPEELLANPFNFRLHPAEQQNALAGSVDEIGFIDPVIVNQNTGHVVDGHLRVTLALRSGEKSIPVVYVDLTEDEEKKALLLLDPIAALAAQDREKTEELLSLVSSDDDRVQQHLRDMAEQERPKIGHEITEGEYEISAELFERHDYLVFYFDNEMDFQVACEKFGVKPVLTAPVGNKTIKQKGLSRVLPGKALLHD